MTVTIPHPRTLLAGAGTVEAQRLLAVVGLGLAQAVEANVVSARDASLLFFVPAFLMLDKETWPDTLLIEALHAGSELEDVAKHAPKGLPGALQEIRQKCLAVLRGLDEADTPLLHKWVRKADDPLG